MSELSRITERPRWILLVIILSQFAGTSLWFASNAVIPDLKQAWGLGLDSVGITTSAAQLGFILGTLAFAFFTIADRFSPRKIFFICSVVGALFNIAILAPAGNLYLLLLIRVLTGICLAGIYPVGMKIAYGWYRQGLGHALGFLVGALVVGTSFPHFVRSLGAQFPWEDVIIVVSLLAATGGVLTYMFVPDGPYLTKRSSFVPGTLKIIFHSSSFRSAAFGYFGHMWELYTFYAFVPFMLTAYIALHQSVAPINISLWSFAIIAAGSLGCAGGGLFSDRLGSARVAWVQLLISGLLCCLSPFLYRCPEVLFLSLLVLWGITVVGDSPQFSTLVARTAPAELVGSALTITNSIGFAITIVSIEFISHLSQIIPPEYLFLFLAPGPLVGLLSSYKLIRANHTVAG
ncbi:MAG: nitrate/nitrite transporter [Bacteroidota bacterium]